MAIEFIGIGEMICSNAPEDEILTLGLGSCVALVLIHAPSRSGAMAHIALPDSKSAHLDEKRHPPAYFADLAVDRLLHAIELRTGANPRNLDVAVIGGACMRNNSALTIGTKNVRSVLAGLSKFNIAPRHRLVGGHLSRSARLQVGSGTLWVKEADAPERVLHPAQGYPFKKHLSKAN